MLEANGVAVTVRRRRGRCCSQLALLNRPRRRLRQSPRGACGTALCTFRDSYAIKKKLSGRRERRTPGKVFVPASQDKLRKRAKSIRRLFTAINNSTQFLPATSVQAQSCGRLAEHDERKCHANGLRSKCDLKLSALRTAVAAEAADRPQCSAKTTRIISQFAKQNGRMVATFRWRARLNAGPPGTERSVN